MNTVIHKAEDRGKGEYGWLSTNYSFSFADWYDPTRMGFGALRVLNDDIIAPAHGFGTHSHRDMEIITIVMKGTVAHKDSMGNAGTVPAGDVQVMSAGTGISHSEYNDSEEEPLELFQLWIQPAERGIRPRYEQRSFDFTNLQNGSTTLVGEGALAINQDARISFAVAHKDHPISYVLDANKGAYVFVVEGGAMIASAELSGRDAIGISGTESFEISTAHSVRALIIEVPLAQ